MVFSSFEFLFRFLPFFLLIYYVTPQKWKNAVLFAGSILFYTAGEAEYVVLLLASVVINYVFGRLMYRDTYEGRGKKQLILLIVALCYDFGVLFLFKYSGFMDKLPLGISFYTFQIAAYIIDVYRGRVPVEKSFIRLGTYVTMFPQLIAGPIINYSEVRMALCSRTVTFEQFESGLKILILGLGAKVIVADRIGLLWNNIQAIGFESISTPLAWMGAFAYSIELYFDFSGYSLMALGLGRMLGFEFPKNFKHPYISRSVSEFWRRWHITLGRWFREYVYIPLGGNRKGKARTIFICGMESDCRLAWGRGTFSDLGSITALTACFGKSIFTAVSEKKQNTFPCISGTCSTAYLDGICDCGCRTAWCLLCKNVSIFRCGRNGQTNGFFAVSERLRSTVSDGDCFFNSIPDSFI